MNTTGLNNIMILTRVIYLVVWVSWPLVSTSEQYNTAVSAANNDFTKDVYLNIILPRDENSIISPLSFHLIMGLTSFGAKGETANVMMKGLRIKHSDTLLKDYKGIIEQLNQTSELKIAEKIYIASHYQINPTFQNVANNNFLIEINPMNFLNGVSAAEQMNAWLEEKTNSKVQNLITKRDVSDDTKMILLNVIHFTGKWSKPFDHEATFDETFYSYRSPVIPMMHQTAEFYMYEEPGDEGYKMIELPYVNESFSMHIFLPNQIDGLTQLEKKLFDNGESFAEKFGNIVKNAELKTVHITLPRFKFESEWEFKQFCQKLGMGIIYTEHADFSSITPNNSLAISKIVQKSFIHVNEEGSEIVNTLLVTPNKEDKYIDLLKGIPKGTKIHEFRADHPFITMLLDDEHNIILQVSKLVEIPT